MSQTDFTTDEMSAEELQVAGNVARRTLEQIKVIPGLIQDPPDWFIASCFHDECLTQWKVGVAFERLEARSGYYKAILPLLFTHMIIVGHTEDSVGYNDRWCYGSFSKAYDAFKAWDGAPGTEPGGWHRHPATGRRREVDSDGNVVEYFNP